MAIQHHWHPMGAMPRPYVTVENGVPVIEGGLAAFSKTRVQEKFDSLKAEIAWIESELDGKEVDGTTLAGCCGCSR